LARRKDGRPLTPANRVEAKRLADRLATEQTVDPTEGRVIAYLIASEVFRCDVWFALDDSFNPGDGLAVFYADELSFLATKNIEQLREIHKVKLAFGPGARVRQ
jgi:hypothetical protein